MNKNYRKHFSSYVQYLKKYSSALQQLAPRGGHRVSRQEGYSKWRREGRREMVALKDRQR